MDDFQRIQQRRRIAFVYKTMFNEGRVPPLHTNCDDSRRIWMTQKLGRLISTSDACEDCELNFLMDILNGKSPKVHARLLEVLGRTKRNPDGWAAHVVLSTPRLAKFIDNKAGHLTVADLPFAAAYYLLQMVEPRERGYRKSDWRPRRSGAQVSNEQATLWGM